MESLAQWIKTNSFNAHGKSHKFMCKECFYVFESSGDYYEHYSAIHASESQLRHKKIPFQMCLFSRKTMMERLMTMFCFQEKFELILGFIEKLPISEWNWWPFWQQEVQLNRLIAEADANPKDAVIQGEVLLAKLNKHDPESVINRFEQRDHAVDSKGVAEYLRALVVTNSITEYLLDEQSGKPDTLPSLLQELKKRASGNMDESFMSPGISKKQPLYVVMVEPKSSNRSRFTQELIATILFTIAFGMMWFMAQSALSKYVGGLGGMGSSGVGSCSSYSPKDLNREVMPEKLTAYHESGHAIVAFSTEAAYPIHKVTILPKGSSLGMVTQLPSDDQTSIRKKQLLASLDVCMGGRVAEELIFGKEHVTTGASDDFKAATKLANSMVSTYGMSDVIGPVYMKEQPGSEMQSRVDAEVEKLLREAYVRVKALLKKATIMPRGSALGMVTQLPSDDETSIRKKQLLPRLDVCMGGRIAEELIFGQEHVTTGASSDLKKTTDLAQYMAAAQLDHFLAEFGKKEVKQLPKLFNEDPTVMEWRIALVGKTYSFSELECG